MSNAIVSSASVWDFRYEEHRQGHVRIGCTLEAKHLNPAGTVHGGVLLTLLDEAGSIAGLFDASGALRQRSVTVSLTGQFVAQASSGDIHAIGSLVRAGRRIYFSRADIFDAAGTLLAFGSSTHRYVTTSG